MGISFVQIEDFIIKFDFKQIDDMIIPVQNQIDLCSYLLLS